MSNLPKPVLKWVGGKTQLLPELLTYVPEHFNTYHEPFFGGGALFFALCRLEGLRGGAQIADANPELINLYVVIRDQIEPLLFALGELAQHHVNKADYNTFRQDYYAYNDVGRAALLVYFNKTSYNGVMRQNRAGGWNMPWGKYPSPVVRNEEVLRAAHQALQGVTILLTGDFGPAMASANRGDFIYCDPPYVPVSKTAKFTGYTKEGFSLVDQERLAAWAVDRVNHGVTVIVSNSDTPKVRELYQGFDIHIVQARRAINCQADKRDAVNELIIVGKP